MSATPPDPNGIETKPEFAAGLTRLREQAGLTVRDVARRTGQPYSTLGGYFSGRHLPPLAQPEVLLAILRVCGVTAPAVAAWQAALGRVRRAPGPRPGDAPAPYRGLASFQPDDAGWFFGRDQLIRAVIDCLTARRVADDGPVVVVGPSGAGKSSLLRAGVIPAVRRGELDRADDPAAGGRPWQVRLFTPGAQPLAALAGQLVDLVPTDSPADVGHALRHRPATIAGQLDRRVLLVVDQFEELFTECTDDADRQEFLTALTVLARSVPAVIGLRADFYHRALAEPLLVPAIRQGQVAVGPMDEADLRAAIVGPARKAGLVVEDGLVEVILRDLAPGGARATPAAHDVGALPLLSHALRATWEHATGDRLTVADYNRTGGIRGAIAATADAVVDSLGARQRRVARQVLVRLVRVGDDAPNTRRRVRREELDELLREGDDGQVERPDREPSPAGELTEVLDRFVGQRLITVDSGTVEITHEALVAAWPRLRGWIDADRRGLLIGQQLDDAARQWRREERDPALLYRGTRLAAAREWVEAGGRRQLSTQGSEFLQASIGRERRRVRVLQQTVAALAGLLLVAVTGGILAIHQRAEAVNQRSAATSERNLALSRLVAVRADRLRETDPGLARQLALAAYQVAPTVEARSSLLSATAGPEVTRVVAASGVLQAVAIAPDGRTLAGAGADGGIRFWDVADPYRPQSPGFDLPAEVGVANAVAFAPDGGGLVAGGSEPRLQFFDLTGDGTPTGLTLPGPEDPIHAVAVSPDGTLLAAGGEDETVFLWDLTDRSAPVALTSLTEPGGSIAALAFSPDGDTLVAGGYDRAVHRWDVADPGAVTALGEPLAGPELAVFAVAFGPDGDWLAGASADRRVYLWDLTDPAAAPEVLSGPSSWVNSVAVSPDGRTVVAGSSDGLVWRWDRGSGAVLGRLPHAGPVTEVVFAPDGAAVYTGGSDGVLRRWVLPGPTLTGPSDTVHALAAHDDLLAAASGDGAVYLWDVADPQRPEPLATVTADDPESFLVGSVAIHPTGGWLVAGGFDGALWRWDLTDPGTPVRLPPLTGASAFAEQLAFRADGEVLAVGGSDGTVGLWDVTDPADPSLVSSWETAGGHVYAVEFSPDGQVLAVGGLDGVARRWDVTDPAAPASLGEPLAGHTNAVYAVSYRPDGRTLAVGSADGTVRLWDVTDPAAPVAGELLTGPTGYVVWAEFSPDGSRLATANADHTVRVWDVTDPAVPESYAVLTAPTGSAQSVAFHAGGTVVAASSQDTTVRLWQIDPGQVARDTCRIAGDPVTEAEWAQHVPGLSYQPPCSPAG